MDLKGKHVVVVGMGKSGLAAARFLRGQGAQVTISDSRPATALSEQIETMLAAGVAVETGGHGLLTFRRQDLLVVSPGVPIDTPELKQAQALGVPVIGEVELASRYLRGNVLGITGSNGKTTTTTLVGEILKHGGFETQVGGNIGLPVVEMINGSKDNGWSVLELSSFQLETIETFAPKIAVVLNITPDHLDRHGTFESYAAAKTRITENQTANDFLILNAEDKPTQMVAAKTRAQIYWFSPRRPIKQGTFVHGENILFLPKEGGKAEPIMPVSEIPLVGMHNVENVLAAVCASRLAGVRAEKIREAVRAFQAVDHRLQFVAEIAGVKYYNDSKATNVDATAKALAAFERNVRLILGGKDKGSDYTELAELLKQVACVYTIGSAAEKIESQLAGLVKMKSAKTLDVAVRMAAEDASPGDIVLLAPACASFDQFTSYEYRGRTFVELVRAMEAK